MKIRQMVKENRFFLLGIVLVWLLGIKHLVDTKKGAVESGELWLVTNYRVLFIFVIVILCLLGWMILVQQRLPIEKLFLLSAISLGFIYSLVLPPLSAPDEVSHYISAYKLSNQLMGKAATQEHGLVYIRKEDYHIENIWDIDLGKDQKPEILGQFLDQDTYVDIHERGFFGNVDKTQAISNQWTVNTTPLAYIPQAVGITIARILNLSAIGLLFMGRWCNLLFYAFLTYLAMRRLPFGKEVLFGVSLLPMVLHLGGSMSYDVMILAMSFYFTAICMDLTYCKEKVSIKDILLLAAVIVVLAPCKIVYSVVLGFCLLIPPRKFGSKKAYLASAAFVLAAFLASMILVNSQTVVHYVKESESYIEWAQETGYSFAYLVYNPNVVFEMLYNTIIWQSKDYHLNMIGLSLGNMDPVLNVPYLLILAFSACLLVLMFRKPGEQLIVSKGRRVWILLVCGAGIAAIMFSMLLAWTPVGAKTIEGVQGRYFLPFLPAILFCLKNDWIVLTKSADRKILFGMCLMNGYILLRLFSIVTMRL